MDDDEEDIIAEFFRAITDDWYGYFDEKLQDPWFDEEEGGCTINGELDYQSKNLIYISSIFMRTSLLKNSIVTMKWRRNFGMTMKALELRFEKWI